MLKAYQEHFKSTTQQAIKLVVYNITNSRNGIYTFPWDCKTPDEKHNPLMIISTCVSIGGIPCCQLLWKKRKILKNQINEKSEEIDQEILKTKIDDKKSHSSKEISYEKSTSSIDLSIQNDFSSLKTKSKKSVNSSSFKKEVAQILNEENDDFDVLIGEMKSKARKLNNIQYEYDFTNNINKLSTLYEKMCEKKNREIYEYKAKKKYLKKKFRLKITELEKEYNKKIENEKNNIKKTKKDQKQFKNNVSQFYKEILETYIEQKNIFENIDLTENVKQDIN
ncbi:hypothetical protein M0813_04418 [Anaeramoeba flamelloides]|uniref:Uncharacterized protein n=1 Tax=Anaeramoeba flamelloides TaxID=1746091 RepID=A0ABQ8XK87_9EUKA|nr:hypothetical protein M0813_04418 [Anaeramoeba flamelloides]